MFDNVLLWTIIFVLALGVIGAILRVRRRDTCLKSFSGYLVYVRTKSGKQIWGQLRTESTGIELTYRSDHLDRDGHIESSYVIFKGEFPNIYLIIRFQDELTEKNARRREKTLRRSYQPNVLRRMRRKTRNTFNLLRDAINQALAAAISATTKTAPAPVSSQQKIAGQTGTEVVEWFGNSYDPILERHIGHRVVMEVIAPDGERVEYVGVFREYSPDYLEVMDVTFKDGEKDRLVDLIVPRAHGYMRHSGESLGKAAPGVSEPASALLKDPSEPETVVDV